MPNMEMEDLSRRIVEATPDAVIFADRDGVMRLWNDGAEALFGFTTGEAVGQSLDLIIPERLQGRHWEGYHRVMATGVTKYGREMLSVPAVRKDGSRLSLEFSVALVRDAAGDLLGIVAVLRDVTARFDRDRELRQRLTALEGQLAQAGATTGE